MINILDTQTSNLIAAGEVVERPASVVKELMENSIDAEASKITVEIKNGGVSYIRVTDNGCGMKKDDAEICLLRHATSKISCPQDLSGIATLGFRGEALAAISSVSHFRIFTKRKEDANGTLVVFSPDDGMTVTEVGCPDGTSMIAEDLFYNVPARRKFLKKDFSEAMAVGSVVEHIAISHPQIAIQYIVDNKIKYSTKGDGRVDNSIYSVLGKDFLNSLIEIKNGYTNSDISISGYISKPECGRSNRNMQYIFLNGRTIRSKTVSAALDESFKTYMPEGNFPTCVLFIDADVRTIDVNVHPTKQEVKFTNDKMLFDSVYYAVKNTLSNIDSHPELKMKQASSYAEAGMQIKTSFIPILDKSVKIEPENKVEYTFDFADEGVRKIEPVNGVFCSPSISNENNKIIDISYSDEEDNEKAAQLFEKFQKEPFKIIGEAYNCYIFVELEDKIMVIDKHAAHERILYNDILKEKGAEYSQSLLIPITVSLSKSEMVTASEYLNELNDNGFEAELFGTDGIIIRQIPNPIVGCDISSFVIELIGSLSNSKGKVMAKSASYERALFSAACKAAMKGGQKTSSMINEEIINKVLTDNNVRYCPHGRPVAYEIKKSSLENQFGR